MKILINQIAYSQHGPKSAIIQNDKPINSTTFCLRDANDQVCFEGPLTSVGHVANWHTGDYWQADFSQFEKVGTFSLEITTKSSQYHRELTIDDGFSQLQLLSAMTYWFKGQRATGEWADVDRHATFQGPRDGSQDVHGGWFDATGDVGVHTSHQSHTSFYNPQQLPLSVYAFYRAGELLKENENGYVMLKRRMLDEASYGADTLMRRYVPERSFIKSVQRRNAFDVTKTTRQIGFELHHSSDQFGNADTAKQEVVDDLNYETSMRSGGGLAVAALAIAARHPYPSDFEESNYLEIAERVYAYLETHNARLINDGIPNLVDAYCALLAVTELYKTTASYGYLIKARKLVDTIHAHVSDFNQYQWLTVTDNMPYFHPSDEGLPIVALSTYYGIETDPVFKDNVRELITSLTQTELMLSQDVINPFNYPRLLAKNLPSDATITSQFFFPHHTTAAPWWQGENARLASWSTAANLVAHLDPHDTDALARFSQAQIDWICGKNPYDICMIEGFGAHHIQYYFGERRDFLNAPGGIVNGITSGLEDETDIAFIRSPKDGVDDNWRWAEQWIPHVSWMILAIATQVSQGEGQ